MSAGRPAEADVKPIRKLRVGLFLRVQLWEIA